jgi:hypothetical protein
MKSDGTEHSTPSVVRILGILSCVLLFSCDNYIIERSASEYFPYKEGNWWRYSNNSVYEPQVLLVEVSSKDTILQRECYRVSFSGDIRYLAKGNKSISEYIAIIQHFSGDEDTIVEGFMKRIEFPLLKGNSYQDSLCDSLDYFGDWVKGKYEIEGLVADHEYDKLYGDIYKVVLTTIMTITSSDTTIVETGHMVEFYAPHIGLVRFSDNEGEYNLVEYDIQ